MIDENKGVRVCLILFFISVVLFFVFLCVASFVVSVGYKQTDASRTREVIASVSEYETSVRTFVIDPGHGGEDPGAVSGEYIEKTLNLSVASYVAEFLELTGQNVIMTRNTDVLLYKAGEENRKKFYDLKNRCDIASNAENGIYIGIHMNKFPLESCKGLQTFYSQHNEESMIFAELIQQNAKILDPSNKRVIKPCGNNIYVLENLSLPAVLVECGFISNTGDAENLSDKAYQKRLAFLIYCASEQYLGGTDEN